MHHLLISALALVFVATLAQPAARAQYVRQQVLPVPSFAATVPEILAGKQGTPFTVAGLLRMPKGEKLPAVILMHDVMGMGASDSSVDEWSRVLNEEGIATFAVDSFTARGTVSPPADTGKVAPLTRLPDAYAALQVLAKSPHIDPKRIAIMGFSHSTTATLQSNAARFQKLYGSPDLQFAAHVALYSICIFNFREDEDLTKPALLLHGTADDLLPIEPCREYVARAAKAGKNIRLIEFPDAHHDFDAPIYKTAFKYPLPNPIKCRVVENESGTLISKETNQPFTPNDPCIGKGGTLQYNEAAAKKAQRDVTAFLKDVFAQK